MMAKYRDVVVRLGDSRGVRDEGIASNTLWPRTLVATAAVQNLLGGDEAMGRARKPDVYADAAYVVLNKPAREYTGNACCARTCCSNPGSPTCRSTTACPASELGVDLWVDTPTRPDTRARRSR